MAKRPSFLDGEFNLPKLEEKVLKFWGEQNIFEKSLQKNKAKGKGAKSKKFVFYEGPPYANGKPAIHHVLARVVKDVMLRYKTMRGYYVPRRAGWDTHGLPVEMAAEKVLGFKTKKDIEKFGVKRFNEEAKKQVWIHRDEWERLTNRIGYWLDLENAYVTYAPEYIESIWWTLAEIWKRGLLYKGHKVVPWCTRCGTALSSHELAQGYQEVVDQSVYVKFKLKPGQKIGNIKLNDKTYVLSWTTTPWTLPGNVALAVGEKIAYVFVEKDGETLICAKDSPLGKEFGASGSSVKGKDLVGLAYEPLFDVAPLATPKSYKIYPADFVTTTDGTGVVHTAVMYGEDDYELGKKVGLPQHHTVNVEGKFTKDVPALAGEYAKGKETEKHIFEYLAQHGNLLRSEEYKHEYPFCWRCGTAILYYARTSWFIAMSKLRGELLKRNETIHWMPEHVKEGRFGEWLREAKDWNLSRERYWGAPLPIWECRQCGHTEVIESLEKLAMLAGGAKNNYWAMRHGEAENNVFHVADSGAKDFHLTPKGRKSVLASAAKLKKIDLVIASDVLRAKETAEIVAKELGIKKVIFDKNLREMDLGPEFDGKPIEKFWDFYSNRHEDRFMRKPPGGESLSDIRKRVWHFLSSVEKKYNGKNILIISHGDPLLMLTQAAIGLSDKKVIEQFGELYTNTGEVRPLTVKTIPRDDTGLIDLHRPFVDDISFGCSAKPAGKKKCTGTMHRVREVADVWYDSGAMPYAQAHYPFAQKTKSDLDYPADYIAEGMDQTRGWFYTLLAIATALGYEAPYKHVITFGLMNDKFGKKMSKSKGNVVEPFNVIDTFGVDAVRWYFYSGTPFGEPKNFDEQEVGKALRKVHLIVYNSFVFWKTYAEKASGAKKQTTGSSKNVLDVWVMARLAELTASVTKKLDAYEIREAALEIEAFVDDLSRWYIRRSRRRLQRPDDKKDYEAASATLKFVLRELVTIMAPFTPFFSEALYAALGGGEESVHLEAWPEGTPKKSKPGAGNLIKEMQRIRELAALGLAARAEAKIKVRQPLASLTVKSGALKLSEVLLDVLAEEVNVKKVVVDAKIKAEVELDTAITPELREEGFVREIARMVQELRQKAGLAPQDKIALMAVLPKEIEAAITKHENGFRSDVGAKSIIYKRSEKFGAEQETKIDGQDVWIGLRKL